MHQRGYGRVEGDGTAGEAALPPDAYCAAMRLGLAAGRPTPAARRRARGMVTPNRRSIRAMVTGLWVMAMKRVWVRLRISSSMWQNRSTLASSSGASTSSSTQTGAGLARNTPKIRRRRRQGLLAAGHQAHGRQALAGRAGVDLQAGLQRIVGLDQLQLGLAAARTGPGTGPGSGSLITLEGGEQALAAFGVQLVDALAQLGDGAGRGRRARPSWLCSRSVVFDGLLLGAQVDRGRWRRARAPAWQRRASTPAGSRRAGLGFARRASGQVLGLHLAPVSRTWLGDPVEPLAAAASSRASGRRARSRPDGGGLGGPRRPGLRPERRARPAPGASAAWRGGPRRRRARPAGVCRRCSGVSGACRACSARSVRPRSLIRPSCQAFGRPWRRVPQSSPVAGVRLSRRRRAAVAFAGLDVRGRRGPRRGLARRRPRRRGAAARRASAAGSGRPGPRPAPPGPAASATAARAALRPPRSSASRRADGRRPGPGRGPRCGRLRGPGARRGRAGGGSGAARRPAANGGRTAAVFGGASAGRRASALGILACAFGGEAVVDLGLHLGQAGSLGQAHGGRLGRLGAER